MPSVHLDVERARATMLSEKGKRNKKSVRLEKPCFEFFLHHWWIILFDVLVAGVHLHLTGR